MNGFTEHLPGSSERRRSAERLLTWSESRAMLPLVGRVARDIVGHRKRLAELRPERDRLERGRQRLDWPQRQRRYHVQDEIDTAEKELAALAGELDTLGVVLLDPHVGLIGFPTMVNNRPAFFSWQPDEESLTCWNFADDTIRRPIPEDWTKPAPEKTGRLKRHH
jgi:hypothetical protein